MIKLPHLQLKIIFTIIEETYTNEKDFHIIYFYL
jgi:hypothetical protein